MDLNPLFKNITPKDVKKGNLISFNYLFHKAGHDPAPNVIVTDSNQLYIRGLNIHYLTFPYIRNLLKANYNNPSFSYGKIKGDKYLVSSFRQYKISGIRILQQMDRDFVLNMMGSVRAISPNEVEAIRKNYNEQVAKITNQIIK